MDTTIPFNKACWRATHNSYSGGERGSLRQQLDAGVRFLELDVNVVSPASGATAFQVGHESPGAEVYHGGGNPSGDLLSDWLAVVASWSAENTGHTPIIVALDCKDSLSGASSAAGSIGALNDLVDTDFGAALYRALDFPGAWPRVDDLRGRILVVLSGDTSTRLAYADYRQIMFVEYQNDGKDGALKDCQFQATGARGKTGWAFDAMKAGKIVRLWQFGEDGAKDGRAVNLPATDEPFARYDLDYCAAIGALDTGKAGSTLLFPPVAWSGSHKYDTGVRPRVAVSTAGVAVEVHESENASTLWYHVGVVDAASGTVRWGPSYKYDTGCEPSVAVNANGLVLEVHKAPIEDTLYYHVGTLNLADRTISWGPSRKYDSGRQPSVALDASGVAVEVHNSTTSLWCRVGKTRPDSSTITWGASHEYDSGRAPSIALDDTGRVVEVHKSENEDTLWYHTGSLDTAASTVRFDASHKYDHGVDPTVAIGADGVVIEVHKSQNFDDLWYRVGRVNGAVIGWLDSYKYDTGVAPSAALLGDDTIALAHQSQNEPTEWYHIGKIRTSP